MQLLNTIIYLIPSMIGIIASTYLCIENKNWCWFLFASVIMYLVGTAASKSTTFIDSINKK